jgi:hypothetical protein
VIVEALRSQRGQFDEDAIQAFQELAGGSSVLPFPPRQCARVAMAGDNQNNYPAKSGDGERQRISAMGRVRESKCHLKMSLKPFLA